jgi:hypothetical protein
MDLGKRLKSLANNLEKFEPNDVVSLANGIDL